MENSCSIDKIIEGMEIEKLEITGDGTAKILYRPYPQAPPIEIELGIDGANVSKLSEETIKKILLLAELMDDLAVDIEFDMYPTEHGYINPDGWPAARYCDGLGTNRIYIKHRVYESNE